MFKVLFAEQAAQGLFRFTDRYAECFENLFRDSGIWVEAIIIEKYRVAARQMNDRFLEEIEGRLRRNTVFGRKNIGTWFEIVFHVDRRLIVAYYTEDKIRQVRVVEWIGIDQKKTTQE